MTRSTPAPHSLTPVLILLAMMLAAGGLSGCVGMAVGAGAAAATAASEERGIKTAANDLAIKTSINGLLLKEDENTWKNVTIIVIEGRAMLTGTVKTAALRDRAGRIAKRARGVREIINEIQVAEKSPDAVRDRLITIDLRDSILRDQSILSINYSIDTVNGTIYLIGIAQDAQEERRVLSHARHIRYVRDIVSHVVLKNDPRRPKPPKDKPKGSAG